MLTSEKESGGRRAEEGRRGEKGRGRRGEGEGERGSYMTSPHRSHTTPNVHPTVVSPRTARQLKISETLNGVPATSAVKRIKSVAAR